MTNSELAVKTKKTVKPMSEAAKATRKKSRADNIKMKEGDKAFKDIANQPLTQDQEKAIQAAIDSIINPAMYREIAELKTRLGNTTSELRAGNETKLSDVALTEISTNMDLKRLPLSLAKSIRTSLFNVMELRSELLEAIGSNDLKRD